MYRFLFFLGAIIIPVIFGWWIFFPLALLSVYLSGAPIEIIFAGIILDSVYYFGGGLLLRYPLTIFSVILVFFALFLGTRIQWRKLI
jgi:hypothetical protein